MVREPERDAGKQPERSDESAFKVEDRRHWAACHGEADEDETATGEPTRPSVVEEYRQKAEQAEEKLQEYIHAFKTFKEEQEAFRARLRRDVDRRVELEFGQLVGELLDLLDDLDLALSHAEGASGAEPLAQGLILARERFLSALERRGVKRLEPDAATFDPNVSEALRVDPVQDPEDDGKVTETLRPGYRLGDRVIRPARVAVGRYGEPGTGG